MKALLLSLTAALLLFSCGSEETQNTTVDPETRETIPQGQTKVPDEIAEGKALAEMYCASCHALPDPKTLDKKTWKDHVLVRMGALLGVYYDNQQYYDSLPPRWLEPGEGGRRIVQAGVYPPKPVISREEYQKIRKFFLAGAPDRSSPPSGMPAIIGETPVFKPKPILAGTDRKPQVTGVAIDPENGDLYASFYQHSFARLNSFGFVQDEMPLKGGIVDIKLESKRISVTDIGNMFGVDNPSGSFSSAKNFKRLRKGKTELTFDKLQRPVHSTWADLNGDGREDLLMCQYGNILGELGWYENTGGDVFKWHVLHPDDGSVAAYVHDFTQDGLPDIVALQANSDEGIDIYENQGSGNFKKKRILRFDPTYGSAAFGLCDWNGDGRMDLIYANGDNADYPPILKPHHGVRIFEQTGTLEFKEALYLPMNGAYKAEAQDFDLDGDLDILAISYYPDFKGRFQESILFYENQGDGQLKAQSVTGYDLGRWMTFACGDVDQDGDLDVLLGAFTVKTTEVPSSVLNTWSEVNVPLMLLENTSK